MEQGAQRYLDWYMSGRLASYVAASHSYGNTMSILEVRQPAGDMSDPPSADIVFVTVLSTNVRHQSDLGAGRISETASHGTIYVVPPNVATSIEVYDPHLLRCYAIPASKVEALLAEHVPELDNIDFGWLQSGGFRSPLLSTLMERLWNEAMMGNPGGRLLAEGAAQVMLAETFRMSGRTRTLAKGGLAPWAERRVIEYLKARAFEDVSLAELAALVQLSPFHFARMFKATTGLPPHAYQRRLRCEHAQDLLRKTDLTIGSISVAVGYETPQAFARMFRAETGRAPSDWRREVRA